MILKAHVTCSALVLAITTTGACGCGGGSSTDPRCNSVCAITEPDIAGAFDVCSAASTDACKQECSARIADVTSLCALCLVEDAHLGGAEDSVADGCDQTQCTVTGREGTCSYPVGDQAASEDCLRQVYPRRTVDCTTEYRPVSECSAECGSAGQPDGG